MFTSLLKDMMKNKDEQPGEKTGQGLCGPPVQNLSSPWSRVHYHLGCESVYLPGSSLNSPLMGFLWRLFLTDMIDS